MVILDKDAVDAALGQGLALIGFRKEATLIAENRWRDELQLWNRERFNLHETRPVSAVTLARSLAGRQGGCLLGAGSSLQRCLSACATTVLASRDHQIVTRKAPC